MQVTARTHVERTSKAYDSRMNVIHAIDAGRSEEEFDADMRSESCTWRFRSHPDLKSGDLMFFGYHGRVRSVGRVTRVTENEVETIDHMYFTCDLEWEDPTSPACKPVESAGEALAQRLACVANDYGEYFTDEPVVFLPPL